LHRRSAPSAAAPDRALELLRERFARGEIDEQEFEARRRVLKG
jgi:putative membrane protein